MEIAKGAEAILTRENNIVKKNRIAKNYRIKTIDEKLRKQRTRSEASLIRAARRAGINVPAITDENGFEISMEFVAGSKVKGVFDKDHEKLAEKIASTVARMHENNIIHGDLTTSNMILKDNEIYFIDDKSENVDLVKAAFPQVTTYFMQRPEDSPYGDRPSTCECADHTVKGLDFTIS